ncbi:WGxxGxxG family protein [Bacillus pseudomycoides]|uniref:GNAT family acetyltransferase n=1 Tax=Bacillus pseudomycoides TaxID=64104 RepID=A0A2B6S8T6_9BACI|nr:WGxxGxxG family protein [Bacillus pseudomycoides]PDY47674.1 GNAT family acetyltransferase [Bacillus pseudomycoides]PEA84746.1 GNAT family acetyltransferase [Bacillus pseudomycoides]PED09078.1 GNAT family acetyltransferase [Bacillus pseudomycoides]PED70280.1 GNAT family acetyltransferase [Bacillus pseudomycoides]PEI40291.1 GNAT family acetyltransferase [Bacillus pseudomycoides]
MKKKLSSILGALLLTIMVFGTSIHAEYDGYNTDRVNNNNITTRVNDNNMNRVNYDTRTRVNDNNMNRVNYDTRTRNVNTTNDLNTNRKNNNWAWLGLLGLLGLFGLRKKEKEPERR